MFGQSPVSSVPNVMKIVKLSPEVVEELICVSDGMEGVQTHYLQRTVICGGAECALCLDGRPTRFLGFVAVRWRLGLGLLRLTSGPATQLMAMQPRPGLVVAVKQKNPRSPIRIQKKGITAVPPDMTISQLELLNCLSHLFGVGSVDFDETYDVNLCRLQALACKQTKGELLPFTS
jgi:hypothetical protein